MNLKKLTKDYKRNMSIAIILVGLVALGLIFQETAYMFELALRLLIFDFMLGSIIGSIILIYLLFSLPNFIFDGIKDG